MPLAPPRPHPRRDALLDLLQRQPGLCFTELQARLRGVPGHERAGAGALSHHLWVLEREGLVASRRSGRVRRYYSGPYRGQATTLAQLQGRPDRDVAEALLRVPGAGIKQLQTSALPHRSRQIVGRILHRLQAAGLAVGVRRGRFHRWWPSAELERRWSGVLTVLQPPGAGVASVA
jgi:predicted transcriptional regulator